MLIPPRVSYDQIYTRSFVYILSSNGAHRALHTLGKGLSHLTLLPRSCSRYLSVTPAICIHNNMYRLITFDTVKALETSALEQLMKQSPRWPVISVKEQGWSLAHNAIRADAADIRLAIASASIKGIIPSSSAHIIRVAWDMLSTKIKEHNKRQEEIVYPLLRTRIDLPKEVGEDIIKLHAAMDGMDRHLSSFTNDGLDASGLLEEFDSLMEVLFSYMELKEDLLPLIRLAFTEEEIKVQINANIMAANKDYVEDFAWVMRPIGSKEKRRALMDLFEVPVQVQDDLFLPAVDSWIDKFLNPLESIMT